MKFSISNERDNTNLKRKELIIVIDHVGGATPSTAGIQQMLSKEFEAEPEKIEVKSIFSLKGRQKSKIKIFVWEDKKVENLSVPKKAEGEEQKAE